jgi:hypothetical protein
MEDDPVEVRMEVARRAVERYASDPNVAAVGVAGSVGRGTADVWSDLELDVYWHEPPDDAARRRVPDELGAAITQFWPYSPEEREWGEEYRVDGLSVGISGFLTATVDDLIDRVVGSASTSPDAQMRLAAIRSGRPLHGADHFAGWRQRTDDYPDELRRRMVLRYLDPSRFDGWRLRDTFVERDDLFALHDLLARCVRNVLGALHGVNRIYLADPKLKWEQRLVSEMPLAPADLAERLRTVWTADDVAVRVSIIEALVVETVALATAETGADLRELERALAERRSAWPPTAGPGS